MHAPHTTALITGASRGLGLETARLLASRGYRLVLTSRGAAALEAVAAELARVTELIAISGDIADAAHVERLVRSGRKRFGSIDILINNASTVGPSPMPALAAYPIADLATVFDVNVFAPLRLVQLLLAEMQRQGSGVVINISSDAGVEAYPGWGGYGASKAALEHLTRVLAAEVEGSGVRVYIVDPGDMDTEMHRAAEPGVDLSHLPDPATVAPALLHLIEDERTLFGRFEAQRLLTATIGGRA